MQLENFLLANVQPVNFLLTGVQADNFMPADVQPEAFLLNGVQPEKPLLAGGQPQDFLLAGVQPQDFLLANSSARDQNVPLFGTLAHLLSVNFMSRPKRNKFRPSTDWTPGNQDCSHNEHSVERTATWNENITN